MKTGNKKFIAGLLVGLILATSLPVLAETVKTGVTVYLGRTGLTIDGKASEAETLLYNDTLYIPISIAARELGFSAVWDEKTNVTNITMPKTAAAKPAPAPVAPEKPPFENGVPLRECLGNIMDKYNLEGDMTANGSVYTVSLDLGGNKATVTFNLADSKGLLNTAADGKVTFDKKTAKFQFYIAEVDGEGRTMIVEQSLIDALKEVGFIK